MSLLSSSSSSSSANVAITIAVVKGEEGEEATPGGLAGTTMMTTDHTHHHPGDTAPDHQGTCTYIWTTPHIVVTQQPATVIEPGLLSGLGCQACV